MKSVTSVLVLLAACSTVPSDPIDGAPTIVGDITMVDTSQDQLRVLVEENPEVQEPLEGGGSKIWFRIVEETAVFDIRSGSVIRVSGQSLQIGLEVEALANGPIQDSYPQQASAETIVIVH